MRRWLAASSFSLFVLAAVFAYDAHRNLRGRSEIVLEWIAAGIFLVIGLAGVWLRHRNEA